MVITEDRASLKLLTASRITAMDPVISPTALLNATSTRLAKMPMMLTRTICLLRSIVFLLYFIPESIL